MKRYIILSITLFIQLSYSIGSQEDNIMVELIDNNHVVESQLFPKQILNESGFTRKLLTSQAGKPIQIDTKSMHGISLSELHKGLQALFAQPSEQEKEDTILTFLNNLPTREAYPPFGPQSTLREIAKETSKINKKNKELQYSPLIKAIALIQLASDLDIPPIEAASIKMLARYLSMHYSDGIPVLSDPYKKKFLDELFSLPITIQNKISNLFLIDSHGDLINKFNRFFMEKTTKLIPNFNNISNVGWSQDGRYLFYASKIKNSPYGRWDSQTDERSLVNPKEYKFDIQKTDTIFANNIISQKSPNNEYIAILEKDNKVKLVNAHTDQLLETFIFSNLPQREHILSKLLWSPDSKKLAAWNIPNEGIKVWSIDLFFQLKKALHSIPLNQLFFLIDVMEASGAYRGGQFKSWTWSDNKIVLKKEEKAQFDSLPDSLKIILKYKIAQFNPQGNFYY